MLKTVGFPSIRSGDQTIVGGNLVIGTAGKGIDFSDDPSASGMTSELLDDYEEGTFITSVTGISNFTGTPTLSNGQYTKIGRLVTIEGKFSGTVTAGSTLSFFAFTLPISRSSGTDGDAGIVVSNNGLNLGGIVNAGASTTTAYLIIPASSAQGAGADVFFFSYSYYS